MKNQDTETKNMMNNQKANLSKITKEKEQLLLSSSNSNEFGDLKKSLEWDETDRLIDVSTRKAIEMEAIKTKHIDSNILDDETIYNYCIDNNYVLVNIRHYKGQLSSELLSAIKEYSINNDRRLESNANLDCLFLLCPFSDVKDNGNNIKKSKRYKKAELPKILLLEQVSDKRQYDSDHYKIIFEIGNRKTIRNFINSIFKTHTKTQNFFNNAALLVGIGFLTIFITGWINIYNPVDNEWTFQFLPLLRNIILSILFIKMVIPSIADHKSAPSLNCHDDSNYKYESHSDFTIYKYNTSFLSKYRRLYCTINKTKVRLKVILSSIIMLIFSYLLLTFMIEFNKNITLNKNKVVFTESHIDGKNKYDIVTTYTKVGLLQNKKSEVKINMSDEAVIKRKTKQQ